MWLFLLFKKNPQYEKVNFYVSFPIGLRFSGDYDIISVIMKKGGIRLKIITFAVGDTLVMKKPHPCGETTLTVLRVGSDVRVRCPRCGRDITAARVKLEKNIKSVLTPKGGI